METLPKYKPNHFVIYRLGGAFEFGRVAAGGYSDEKGWFYWVVVPSADKPRYMLETEIVGYTEGEDWHKV